MSFFGFDLLTDVSVGRYMSGDFGSDKGNGPVDNDEQEEQSPNQDETAVSRSRASASSNGSNGGSGLWNHVDYRNFTHATARRPPPAVPVTIELGVSTATGELMEAEDASSILTLDEVQSTSGGITILSAVPSEDMENNVNHFYSTAPPPIQTLDILAISPHSAGYFSNSHHFQNQHALSISTTESLYQQQHDQQHNMASSSASSASSSSSGFLSLMNPSSLASSAMTSNMAISFTDNSSYHSISRPFSAAVLAAAVSGRHGGGGAMNNYQPTIALIPAAITSTPISTLTQHQQQQPWYARFTEDDWERTLQVLTALGVEEDERSNMMCPDMLAALLIEQEEELFWNKNNQKRRNSWQQVLVLPSTIATTNACWRILAAAVTLSLGATATMLMSSASRRREEQDTSRRVEA